MSLDYESFFRGLNDAGVEYVLVGGLAVNFHGVPRMTYDIDIVARPERQDRKTRPVGVPAQTAPSTPGPG